MSTKPVLQRTLHRILQAEEMNKHTQEVTGRIKQQSKLEQKWKQMKIKKIPNSTKSSTWQGWLAHTSQLELWMSMDSTPQSKDKGLSGSIRKPDPSNCYL